MNDMGSIVDIHTHILPALDDGATDLEMTRQMLRMAYEEGVRYLFFTPHADSFNYNKLSRIRKNMDAIREWCREQEINLELFLGAEIYYDSDESIKAIIKKLKREKYPTLNNTNLVLIEFYMGGITLQEVIPAMEALFEAGYIPVIAHVERYGLTFEELIELKNIGCLFQLNLCDLFYENTAWENEMNQMSRRLVKKKMIDFVGTDAHDVERRPAKVVEYVDYLYSNYDKEYIDDICVGNAERLLKLG